MESIKKKYYEYVVVSLLILLVILDSLVYSLDYTPEPQMIMEISPNLELFAVVYILAFNGSDDFIIAPQSYVRDVLAYFAPYKAHPAVLYLKESIPKDQPYYLRDRLISNFCSNLASMPYLGNLSENDPLLTEFYRQLVDFAKESNFIQFFNLHKEAYKNAVEPLREVLPRNLSEKFTEFFGYSYGEYKVELSYSLWIHPHSGYGVNSVTSVMSVFSNPSQQAMIVLHEFTHPYIEQLMDSYPTIFKNMTYFVDELHREFPVWTSRDPEHYTSDYYWRELFTESFAVYLASTPNTNLTGMAEFQRLNDLAIGYYLIDALLQEFRAFENMKHVNETLLDYFPTLIRHLQNLATPANATQYFMQKVPVTRFWFFERSYVAGKVIIVYGSNNPDESGNEYDRETAFQLKNYLEKLFSASYGFSPVILVKNDRELTNEDLSENLILVGGPVANGITKKLQSKMPIKFTLNESWTLVRNISLTQEFHAFLFNSSTPNELSVSAPIPKEYPFGVVEVIRNPWNEKNLVLIVAGVDRYSTRKLIDDVRISPVSYVMEGRNYVEAGFYN